MNRNSILLIVIEMDFVLKSSAFSDQENIPHRYTCTEEEYSPPLFWENIPENTQSFALIMVDLDTPITNLTHWILFNIPSDQTSLPEAVSCQDSFSNNMIQGRNSMRKNDYMGPCPPFGSHRYKFTLYALDTTLENDPNINKKKLMKEIKGHILAETSLIGVYSKKQT